MNAVEKWQTKRKFKKAKKQLAILKKDHEAREKKIRQELAELKALYPEKYNPDGTIKPEAAAAAAASRAAWAEKEKEKEKERVREAARLAIATGEEVIIPEDPGMAVKIGSKTEGENGC